MRTEYGTWQAFIDMDRDRVRMGGMPRTSDPSPRLRWVSAASNGQGL
jgi:hypothetical protein